jgi:hypothetical protein
MPKSNLTFTIGGIAIHPVVGLQIVREPIRVSILVVNFNTF